MSAVLKPTNTIKARLGIEPNGKIQKFFTNTCYRYMDKYVPYETGNLRTIVDVEKNTITYESPYAHYQYKGKSVNDKPLNYKTPGTGSYWDRKMVAIEMDSVVKEVQDKVRKG